MAVNITGPAVGGVRSTAQSLTTEEQPTVKQTAPSFDEINLRTPEGQQKFKQACLNMGISMPEFVGESNTYIQSLNQEARTSLSSISASVTSSMVAAEDPATPELQSRWADFVTEQSVGGGDVNALVQQVLRESYLDNTKDLYFHASKVKFFNDVKKSLRAEVSRARETLAAHTGDDGGTEVSFEKKSFGVNFMGADEDGQVSVSVQDDGDVGNKAGLESYIESLEDQLNSVGDDSQLANVDLQNMLQKQQQTMQMMSSISKMLHDTAMAVIRKIG